MTRIIRDPKKGYERKEYITAKQKQNTMFPPDTASCGIYNQRRIEGQWHIIGRFVDDD